MMETEILGNNKEIAEESCFESEKKNTLEKAQKETLREKKLLKDPQVSDAAPSSTSSTHSKDIPSNLNLPLGTLDDVERIEQELKKQYSAKNM
ncbi:hypothetical protein E1301_Tti024174 [Triplophysa tibetana]|uniref:Uncharacterized protein n=1 Tax=Triplophysa tibetana TaxID=1572043 RepID=A0A5A9MRZ5_9TELE|nr:hypothetical protein E1301_Tti024174 [Triplophysa tibetana]